MSRYQNHKRPQRALWQLFRAPLVALLLLGGCASTPVSCPLPQTPHINLPTRGISAHRGGLLGCPGNTVGAFQRAIDRGVHQIELDVRLTTDDIVVVAHDDEITDKARTLHISESTLQEIQTLNLESCEGETQPQHVPTLEEALAIMPSNIWINVDMKNNDPHVATLVAETVAEAKRMDQVIFSARKKAVPSVRLVAKENERQSWVGNMSRELFRSQYINATIRSCAEFIQLIEIPYLPFIRGKPSPETMARLDEAGIRVNYSWLRGNDEEELQHNLQDLFNRGIEFVLVDHVEQAMNAADKLNIPRLVPHWDQDSHSTTFSPPHVPVQTRTSQRK